MAVWQQKGRCSKYQQSTKPEDLQTKTFLSCGSHEIIVHLYVRDLHRIVRSRVCVKEGTASLIKSTLLISFKWQRSLAAELHYK